MKVLHLFGNWKWTGPAEPAVDLARVQVRSGLEVTFACALPPDEGGKGIADKLREFRVPSWHELRLNKHFNVLDNSRDVKCLSARLKAEKFDVLHAHTPNDHFIGGVAAKLRSSGPCVVRTSYEGEGMKNTFRNRFLLERLTDGYIGSSLPAFDSDLSSFGMDGAVSRKLSPAVDCDAFSPALRAVSLRGEFGIPADAVCIGTVARIQRHRRFEVLLAAAARLAADLPEFRLVIIGRGTNAEEVLTGPARRLNLGKTLVMTGYRYEDYPRALAMLDVKVFLMPGSDGTCRAARQALAAGIPVIAADRGMLPEIVENGRTGFVIDDNEENLYEKMRLLAGNPDLRAEMGRAARERAMRLFSLAEYELQVRRLYEEVLSAQSGRH